MARIARGWRGLAIVVGWALGLWWAGAARSVPLAGAARQVSSSAAGATDAVSRGKYLVTAIGCTDCHTPTKMGANGPEHDSSRLLSGHPQTEQLPAPPSPNGPWIATVAAIGTAWSGPWGVSYTANLTPDPETGLGRWTEQQFVETIRNGRHQGRGRQILPPMPWQAFRNFSDEDLKAIFAHLRTVPPIKNKVPDPMIKSGV